MQIQATLNVKVFPFFLHEFDTELDFSNKIGSVALVVIFTIYLNLHAY